MNDPSSGANSRANSGLIAPRGRGNPNLRKGGPSLNPSGKAKPADQLELETLPARVAELEAREQARESASADPAGGVVTAARMRKVLGQDPVMDCGPTEQRLREWLTKDVARYESRTRELEAEEKDIAGIRAHNVRLEEENAALKERLARHEEEHTDEGAARARALIDRILRGESDRSSRTIATGLHSPVGQKPDTAKQRG